jgi:hypothetical protein
MLTCSFSELALLERIARLIAYQHHGMPVAQMM